MKMFLVALTALAAVSTCDAFVGAPAACSATRGACYLSMAVDLTPEPEGGEELVASSTIADTRMKDMGEFDGELEEEADGTVHSFWLSSVANGELIKKTRTQLSKEAARNADFPGFRKVRVLPGTVLLLDVTPPVAMPSSELTVSFVVITQRDKSLHMRNHKLQHLPFKKLLSVLLKVLWKRLD